MKKYNFLINIVSIITFLATVAVYAILAITPSYKYGSFHYSFFAVAILLDLIIVGFFFVRYELKLPMVICKYIAMVLFLGVYTVFLTIVADSILWFSVTMVLTTFAIYFLQTFCKKRQMTMSAGYTYALVFISCSIFLIFHIWNIFGSQLLNNAFSRAKLRYIITPKQANSKLNDMLMGEENAKGLRFYKPNGGQVILAACGVISAKCDSFFSLSGEYPAGIRPPQGSQKEADIKKFFKDLEKELNILEEGLSYSLKVIPLDFPEAARDVITMPISHLSPIMSTAISLLDKFFFEMRDQEYEKGIKTLQQVLALADLLSNDFSLMDISSKESILSKSLHALQEVINWKLPLDTLEKLASILKDKCQYTPMKIESDLLVINSCIDGFQNSNSTLLEEMDVSLPSYIHEMCLPDGLIKQDFAHLLHRVMDQAKINRQGEEAVRKSFKNEKPIPVSHFISREYNYKIMNFKYFDRLALTRATYIALKVLIYKAKHKTYPENMHDLQLDKHIVDPYTGNSFKINETRDKYIIYSTGRSFQDQGGKNLNQYYPKYGNIGVR